jgi:hypothetical protein
MKTKKTIPTDVKAFIDKYLALEIKGIITTCPYFINTSGFLKKGIYSGKGDPYEIEAEANRILQNHSFVNPTSDQIRNEMIQSDLGVDCSGLVYHIYNKWLISIGKGELKEFLPKQSGMNLRKILSRNLKPVSSVNADMFTSEPLSQSVEVKDVQPGDLIRTRGGKHLLLITEVEYNSESPVTITFVNSACFYKRNGVRYGEIVLDSTFNLLKSEWKDNDPEEEVNYSYKGYRELSNNNGIFRPKLPLNIK